MITAIIRNYFYYQKPEGMMSRTTGKDFHTSDDIPLLLLSFCLPEVGLFNIEQQQGQYVVVGPELLCVALKTWHALVWHAL